MQGQSEPKIDFPESEKGFEQEPNRQPQDRGASGTGAATGTVPERPKPVTQNRDKSGQDQGSTDPIIRNPSGDDLSEGIEGDEGSGQGI